MLINNILMIIIFCDTVYCSRTIGAYRIASALRKEGVTVEVIDHLSRWDIDKLIQLLSHMQNIEWVGFSLPFDVRDDQRITKLGIDEQEKLLNYFKQKNIPILLGGSTADIVKNKVNNFWISVGYSDIAVVKFHEHIVESKEIIFKKINNNNVIFADEDYYDTIDLGNIELIIEKSDCYAESELIPIEISRGCIFKCSFCALSHTGKKPGTYIRPKNSIKEDISNFQNNFNTKNFIFVDDTFNDSIDKMRMIKEIQQELPKPFNFWSYGRLDLLAASQEQISLIGDTGWNGATFGIETLNRQAGRAIGKGADPEKLKKCLLLIKNLYPKFHIQVNLIVGLAHSTEEDIMSSVDWLIDNDISRIRVVALGIRDPSQLTFGISSLSKNPSKYGYQIIDSLNGDYQWANNHWTSARAEEFAAKVSKYINSQKVNNMFLDPVTNYQADIYIHEKIKCLEELYPTHEYLHT